MSSFAPWLLPCNMAQPKCTVPANRETRLLLRPAEANSQRRLSLLIPVAFHHFWLPLFEGGRGEAVMAELPGKELAQELMQKSREESRRTPMEAVIEAAREGRFQQQEGLRLIGRLWTLERLFYYIYGGWGQGLEIGDCPPSVMYLVARLIMYESTHVILSFDTVLHLRLVRSQ